MATIMLKIPGEHHGEREDISICLLVLIVWVLTKINHIIHIKMLKCFIINMNI